MRRKGFTLWGFFIYMPADKQMTYSQENEHKKYAYKYEVDF